MNTLSTRTIDALQIRVRWVHDLDERVLWIASAQLILVDTTVTRTEAADLAGKALHVLAAGH